jgi:hypothetical protein
MRFIYNDEDQVIHLEYSYVDPDYLASVSAFNFYYDANNRVERITNGRYPRLINPEPDSPDFPDYSNPPASFIEIFQNFIWRANGTLQSFDVGITTIPDVQYVEGFVEGEMIFAEKWMSVLGSFTAGARRMKSGFVPVLNPLHIPGLPPYFRLSWFGEIPMDMFWYKYVYTADVRGPGNTAAVGTYFMEFTHTTGPDGQLESFTRKTAATWGWDTFFFEYAED